MQTLMEFGRLVLEESGETPFQKLVFLVRDWMAPQEFPFGSEGGCKFVKKRLQV